MRLIHRPFLMGAGQFQKEPYIILLVLMRSRFSCFCSPAQDWTNESSSVLLFMDRFYMDSLFFILHYLDS